MTKVIGVLKKDYFVTAPDSLIKMATVSVKFLVFIMLLFRRVEIE